ATLSRGILTGLARSALILAALLRLPGILAAFGVLPRFGLRWIVVADSPLDLVPRIGRVGVTLWRLAAAVVLTGRIRLIQLRSRPGVGGSVVRAVTRRARLAAGRGRLRIGLVATRRVGAGLPLRGGIAVLRLGIWPGRVLQRLLDSIELLAIFGGHLRLPVLP